MYVVRFKMAEHSFARALAVFLLMLGSARARSLGYNATCTSREFRLIMYSMTDSVQTTDFAAILYCFSFSFQFVYFHGTNQGVDFHYYRPLIANETAQKASSKWVPGMWSACSMTCGHGRTDVFGYTKYYLLVYLTIYNICCDSTLPWFEYSLPLQLTPESWKLQGK